MVIGISDGGHSIRTYRMTRRLMTSDKYSDIRSRLVTGRRGRRLVHTSEIGAPCLTESKEEVDRTQ